MNQITIWHNPQCSKSREALTLLEDIGCEKEVLKYLEAIPTKEELKSLLKMLGMSARALIRTKEDVYKELNLQDELNEDKLIEAMVQNPQLIERPIIIKNNKAVIGRPASLIIDFLNMQTQL
jgi:arsenate reductase